MSRFKHPVLLILLLAAMPCALLAVPASRAAGSDDEYLRAIREEGNKLEFLNRAKEEIRQSELQEQRASPGALRLSANVEATAFELALNREAPASYKLYSDLPPEKRKAIYELYIRDGKMSAVKRKIVEFYLGT